MRPALLTFDEGYFERIWGGHRLRTDLGKPAPADLPVGEAWLVADHATYTSTVTGGPWAGQSLHDILEDHGPYLLGTQARPTVHGRFPLLLKILDAADVLSVQVHPDDEAAAALNEPDVGKTEMWHVLASEPGSELICGLDPQVTPETFRAAIADNSIHQYMRHFPAPAGTSAFVSAGTVHAIGRGILLAEIQQNSDLTYRIYDWDRTDDAGRKRELHLDKAAQVTQFGSAHGGAANPLAFADENATIHVLGACRYFAALLLDVQGGLRRPTQGRSFHLLLARAGSVVVSAGNESVSLQPGRAVLVPAGVDYYQIEGDSLVLDYFVPDLTADVVAPLRDAGHSDDAIARLGGALSHSDLAREVTL